MFVAGRVEIQVAIPRRVQDDEARDGLRQRSGMEGGGGHDRPLALGVERPRTKDTALFAVKQSKLYARHVELRSRILEQPLDIALPHEISLG